ncbi:P-loop containing nucleoside triphosphate hydrolase [Pseudocohnilembus persalinus]|uniref:p-loop containing nucleoside triphosphate hydrolase n=1 Tax=Pseudocohnilembus persalinus TaxID=266149 RepID=A0A0V0QZ33_PSEPJ|nr:P-loop containing nucleoside triphosphate hydrolase [Pseudocohnilembus persalinus]|eukprot:KRX07160.1 P-loop containing nucleoside triphosphate hydrolase [Pseudocohnilembus persalinus]
MDKKYYKLVVLGEGRVGKTSLTLRYCNGEFDDNQISTNNASYLEKNVTLDNDETVSISIWDTAGQEKFNALAPMYYRDALGAIIVYDITFKESFDKVQKWIAELKQFGGKDIFLVVAGNKCDLENKRQINKQDAENFAKSQGAHHFQVSAKADVGIDEMFQCLVKDPKNDTLGDFIQLIKRMKKKNTALW